MPYQNFAGWFGTGCVFMTVATLIWRFQPMKLPKTQLGLPLIMYLGNFAFAMVMSLAAQIYIPIFLGILTGVIPILILYKLAQETESTERVPSLSTVPVGTK